MVHAGVFPLDANVQMRHLDRNGNAKPIFQENGLCIRLIKSGNLSPLWINRWYAPFLSPFLGYWTGEKDMRNGVTDAGRAAVASRINGSGAAAAFTAIGQGTGVGAFSASDTTLGTEVKADGTGASGVHALCNRFRHRLPRHHDRDERHGSACRNRI